MLTVAVQRWAAWPASRVEGPEVPGADAGSSGSDLDVSFLPPLLRRRCTPLTRMMLHVAWEAAGGEGLHDVPVVFGSRYGDAAATLTLLRLVARREPLTAAGFSHSVHNAQAGLFSIATGNREAASAVAAGGDTFGAAFLEAVTAMARGGHETALLVVGDELLPDAFARFQEEPRIPCAVALRLGKGAGGLEFRLGGDHGRRRPASLPHALEFVQWLGGSEPTLTLGRRTPFTWTRLAG